MNKAFVVAKWEYLEKVKTKTFVIGLILFPAIIFLTSVLPSLLAGREDESPKVIGIIDATGDRLDALLFSRLKNPKLSDGNPNYIPQIIASGKGIDVAAASHEADTKVLTEDIEGYVLFGANALRDTSFEYRSKSGSDFRLANRLETALKSIFQERRYREKGLDPQLANELKVPLEVKLVKVSKTGEKEGSDFMQTFLSAFIPLMMMFNLFVTSGQLLVRSMLEEKSNRIVEVLVSSCTPTELMSGKVLGLSALGLTQVAFWALLTVGGLSAMGNVVTLNFPPASQLLLIGVYSVLGYLLYAAIFITFGTPVTTEQEAQQISQYLVVVFVLPIALIMPIMLQPNALWVRVLSFFPPLTPTFMTLRMLVKQPGVVEITSSVILLLVSTYVMMIVAGKVFRIGILATGKRPGIGELVRWVKEG